MNSHSRLNTSKIAPMCCSKNSLTSCACSSDISLPSIVFRTMGVADPALAFPFPSSLITTLATACAIAPTSMSRPSVPREFATPWDRKNANRSPALEVYAARSAAFFASSGSASSMRVRRSSRNDSGFARDAGALVSSADRFHAATHRRRRRRSRRRARASLRSSARRARRRRSRHRARHDSSVSRDASARGSVDIRSNENDVTFQDRAGRRRARRIPREETDAARR